jgi:hypothetical protein
MARQDYGNPLTAPVLQPGSKLSNDGYGLLTATCVWKANKDNDLSVGNRGSTCPINAALTAHKFSVSYDNLGMATITVDYIGIDPTVNSGTYTNPEVGASNGLTSENITTNPNFFTDGGDGYDGVIAGAAGSYTQSPIGPLVEIKNVDDFITVITGYNGDGSPITALVNKKQSYIGLNGACFEDVNGGRFIGFVKASEKHFYGKTNYLAPQSSFSGHFYTSEASEVNHMLRFLGTTSRDNDWSSTMPMIVPSYAGTSWLSSTENGSYNQLLLSQVNVQDYGLLYKVNYEVRYSVVGWTDKVYRDNRLMP